MCTFVILLLDTCNVPKNSSARGSSIKKGISKQKQKDSEDDPE